MEQQRRRTVLIVEDNAENLAVYSTIIRHVGFDVIEATTGEQAIAYARSMLPDLITMDISLPGMDGFEATRILKGDAITKHIPIIALTAHALEADRSSAIAAGMNGYLAKPVEPRRVVQEIERFIGAPTFPHAVGSRHASRDATPKKQPRRKTAGTPTTPQQSGTILVVGRGSEHARITSRLRSRGYDVATGSTGEEAVAMAPNADLLVMDAWLSDMDGFTACEEIKRLDPLQQIILVAPTDATADKVTGLSFGADDYLTTPFNLPEFDAMVDSRLRLVAEVKTLRKRVDDQSRSPQHSLTVAFSFPEEVRTSCEQYLLYFAEFLKDVGIGASTDLRHEAGEVLFSVTPDDPAVALGKIRKALDIFLSLPDEPELSDALQKDGDVRALQLLANMHTLHAQMFYARAALEAKDQTITVLQSRLADMISPTAAPMTKSLPAGTSTATSEGSVEFLGGTVELVPWEGKGLRVDTPRIFRWFKKLIESEDTSLPKDRQEG